jgi:hypothetical protein
MKSIWTTTYDSKEIKVENRWFGGERLFVDEQLQHHTYGIFSSKLNGHLFSKTGEKLKIKVILGGFFKVGCTLFINDEKIEMAQIE